VTKGEGAEGELLGLPAKVVERVVAELAVQGEKALSALQTAAALIVLALHDECGLRFAESAAYNVREALDAVVSGRAPVSGGLPVVIEAWERFEGEVAQPDNDDQESLKVFGTVLRSAAERQDRNSYHEAKLLGYIRDKSGVDPLVGGLDPVAEYKRLRGTASQGLHRDTALDTATNLYQETLAWFVRMFTPPDTVVVALRQLATESWRGPDQIDRLRGLASNPHHLRLFFTHLTDPIWLDRLYEADVVPLPDTEAPWPVAALADGLGRTTPAAVATLARRLLVDCGRLRAEQQLDARFKVLVLASGLGPDGHTIVADIAIAHPTNRAVRSLATGAVKRADPADPIAERVGRVVLECGPQDRDSYYYRLVLDRLDAGMTPENAQQRTRMVTAKLRNAAKEPGARLITFGIARLTADLREDTRTFMVVVAHYLARLIGRAHALGVSSAKLLGWVTDIPGQVGERLACRVLALADDIPLRDKIDHVTRRLASQTATGDDKDLIDAVLVAGPEPHQMAVWADALGTPSPPPPDLTVLPRDWSKVWRWSAILPEHLLTRWQEPIAAVNAQHGRIDPASFDHRTPDSYTVWGQSAHSVEDLTALPVLDAARLVAGWRPNADSDDQMIGARELARVLQTAVTTDPQAWTADPATVVETLREPVYVLHYLNALTTKASEVSSRVGDIISAARLATTQRWPPTVLGNDDFDFEPDWHRVDTATVELVTALADHDAPLAEHLDTAWPWALAALDSPSDTSAEPRNDPLSQAINNPRGRGLQAVLSLAGWEHRHLPVIRPQFLAALDRVLDARGQDGMDCRAILARQRPRLELIAQDWLDRRIDTIFRDEELGSATVDLMLQYSPRITPWLLRNLRDDIIAAALRGAEHAVATLLVGTLDGEPGYESDAIVASLRKDKTALGAAAEDMARLVQDRPTDAPELVTAVQFWQALLDANRDIVPVETLRSTGRWAFVAGLPESIWTSLTIRALVLTDGSIDYAIEVADRCEAVPVPGDSTKALLLLQGRGEPWEQHHIANVALNALRTLSTSRTDENFLLLRTRLIELGHDSAADLTPYDEPS
jgi:hypothetical protein